MQQITPCLWYDDQAEEAVRYYTSVFPDSRITDVTHYTEAGPGTPGEVLTVAFELDGRPFVALNGGPVFPFTEAVSLQVRCDDQAEVDRLWAALLEGGGQESRCGWLKDRWGLSWQVTPRVLIDLVSDPDRDKAARVTRAMLTMGKIDVRRLLDAAEG
ncbi:VOC family protein [Kitasatospora putterlickiae]|uniref:VOC family protein n=1 Tax=Kitasatospora putterlickiae TaxID=221725 RepID=A0ABN1XRE5_9ACTN